MTNPPPPIPSQSLFPVAPSTVTFRFPNLGEVIRGGRSWYRIGDALAEGAFGRTYECTDEWGNRLVVKVFLPHDTYEAVHQRWERELVNLFRLRHPNITYVHDAFEHNNGFYIVMERCEGTIRSLPFSFAGSDPNLWVAPIARSVLQAVHFMHTHDYVHKDLHPGNVFWAHAPGDLGTTVNRPWVFKVGDLGISKLEHEIHPTGTLFAVPMTPPEALNHTEFGTVGKLTDVYQVGLLLLFIMTGQAPNFTHQQILDGVPREWADALNSPYGPVIARALRRHVEARTPSALQFWRELAEVAPPMQNLA